jgi:hypothetical protein
MTPLGVNRSPVEDIDPVIEELTTGWMTPLGVNRSPVEDIDPVIEELTTGWMTPLGVNRSSQFFYHWIDILYW